MSDPMSDAVAKFLVEAEAVTFIEGCLQLHLKREGGISLREREARLADVGRAWAGVLEASDALEAAKGGRHQAAEVKLPYFEFAAGEEE